MYSFSKHHLTAIRQVFTCHNIQKSRLSSTIFSDKGNFLVFIDAKRNIFEYNSFPKSLRYIFY